MAIPVIATARMGAPRVDMHVVVALHFIRGRAQQAYPTKPIRLVVPFAPGGGVDNFARPLAQKLTDQLGQQVVVDNRPGASSIIGAALVAAAQPDGYTLLCTFDSPLYISSLITKNVPYHPLKDFTPVISAATTPIVVVVHASLPVQSTKELIEYARRNPGQLAYVTAGSGTQQHLTGESLARVTGTKMTHIAYKGGGQAITDLLGGHVKMGILVLSTVHPAHPEREAPRDRGHRSAAGEDLPGAPDAFRKRRRGLRHARRGARCARAGTAFANAGVTHQRRGAGKRSPHRTCARRSRRSATSPRRVRRKTSACRRRRPTRCTMRMVKDTNLTAE